MHSISPIYEGMEFTINPTSEKGKELTTKNFAKDKKANWMMDVEHFINSLLSTF